MQGKSGNVADALATCPCPHCGTSTRPYAAFCYQCGWELRPACSGCGTRFPLPALALPGEETPAWCSNQNCGEQIYICSQCGHSIERNKGYCASRKATSCQGVAIPVYLQHTGRDASGSGTAAGRLWQGQKLLEAAVGWPVWTATPICAEPIHAVFMANGHLFIWSEGALRRRSDLLAVGASSRADGHRASPEDCGGILHIDAYQLKIPGMAACEERVALAGRCAIMATRESYLFVDLAGRQIPVEAAGKSLAQCGWLNLWAGFAMCGSRLTLYKATCRPDGTAEIKSLDAQDKPWGLRPGARLIAHKEALIWPGADGCLWEFRTSDQEPHLFSSAPVADITTARILVASTGEDLWIATEQIQNIGEAALMISIAAVTPSDRTIFPERVVGPLRSLHATPDRIVVVGSKITHLSPATFDRLHSVPAPVGDYGPALLTQTTSGRHLLFMTTSEWTDNEQRIVRLECQFASQQKPCIVWHDACADIQSLILLSDRILMVTSEGVFTLVLQHGE